MKVSLITVSYNSEKTIEDTIQSVISQDYQDIEYIIIDGASSDATKSIIDNYKTDISCFISEPDAGIYDAMNKGINASNGDLIGILNSDDVYSNSSVVSDMVNALGSSDAVYADLVYVDFNNLDKVKRVWKSGRFKKGAFYFGWMPPHPTFFVKKECYLNFGLYALNLRSAADYELMLRFIHKNNIKVSYLPEIIVKMRVGGVSNISLKNRILANREDKKAWKINNIRPKAFTFFLKPLRKLSQFRI
ncbi:MAG: glycosyl transferase [Crocinitomicaceae bacterium]|nr:glycosyl transferase [Crocinitomicaceae bacterium]|tara:strand:- start:1634 stop:2374 length:741 start_codon:yes stop_codon:yes gene_type:complete